MYNFVDGASNTPSIHLRLVLKLNKGGEVVYFQQDIKQSRSVAGRRYFTNISVAFCGEKVLRQYFMKWTQDGRCRWKSRFKLVGGWRGFAFPFNFNKTWQGRMRVRIDSWADSSKRAHTVSQCSLVHEIIQHVEYSELMARVTKIAEHDTAHLRKQLTPTATSDA